MNACFVGGTGRSGTTIMRRVLGTSPQVAAMPGELRIIVDPGGLLDLADALSWKWGVWVADTAVYQFITMLGHVQSDDLVHYPGHDMDLWCGFLERSGYANWRRATESLLYTAEGAGCWAGSHPRKRLYETEPHEVEVILNALAERIYSLYNLRNPHAAIFVEDSPDNMTQILRLNEMFPDMFFIHMVRDPRDIAASYKGHRTRTRAWVSTDFRENVARIRNQHRVWNQQTMTIPEEEKFWLTVRVEDLAADPIDTLLGVCSYLGIDYSSAMADVVRSGEAHVGRFREDLTPDELALVQKELDVPGATYGYNVWEV